MFTELQERLSSALTAVLPESQLSSYVVANAFFVITVLLVLFIFFFLFTAAFLDFVTDVWKLPFAVAVDVLSYLGLGTPVLSLAAAVLAILIFAFLADSGLRWVFGGVAGLLALLPYFLLNPWVVVIAIIPVASVFMFIDVIID